MADAAPRKPSYKIKNVEPVAIGTDVQARIMTLAPADVMQQKRWLFEHLVGRDKQSGVR